MKLSAFLTFILGFVAGVPILLALMLEFNHFNGINLKIAACGAVIAVMAGIGYACEHAQCQTVVERFWEAVSMTMGILSPFGLQALLTAAL